MAVPHLVVDLSTVVRGAVVAVSRKNPQLDAPDLYTTTPVALVAPSGNLEHCLLTWVNLPASEWVVEVERSGFQLI